MATKLGKSQRANVTMVDVATAAGVSVASVSNVLNQRVKVSDQIRKRVLEAANNLDYQHNLAAKAFKTGISNIIGLIVPNLSSPFFGEMIKLVIDAARSRGYIVSVIDTQNSSRKELESLEFLFQHGIQGVIWFDPRSGEQVIQENTNGHRVVIVDRFLKGFDCVVPEHTKGGIALGEYIIETGHRKIGLISGPSSNYAARARREGILKALKDTASIVWECESEFSFVLSGDTLNHILRRDVSIIVCANDQIAVSALLALRGANIAVPDDVSVTGFDDIHHLCEIVSPKLTSVSLPKESIANEAVELVIGTPNTNGLTKRHVWLGLEIVKRESVVASI